MVLQPFDIPEFDVAERRTREVLVGKENVGADGTFALSALQLGE
jgi:hypothetical protein